MTIHVKLLLLLSFVVVDGLLDPASRSMRRQSSAFSIPVLLRMAQPEANDCTVVGEGALCVVQAVLASVHLGDFHEDAPLKVVV